MQCIVFAQICLPSSVCGCVCDCFDSVSPSLLFCSVYAALKFPLGLFVSIHRLGQNVHVSPAAIRKRLMSALIGLTLTIPQGNSCHICCALIIIRPQVFALFCLSCFGCGSAITCFGSPLGSWAVMQHTHTHTGSGVSSKVIPWLIFCLSRASIKSLIFFTERQWRRLWSTRRVFPTCSKKICFRDFF